MTAAVALALECAGAEVVRIDCAYGVPPRRAGAAPCDAVVVLGSAGFASGRLSVDMLRPRGERRPEIYVVSWQHNEHTVLSLIECGVDQYMTFPLNLRRLRVKVASGRRP